MEKMIIEKEAYLKWKFERIMGEHIALIEYGDIEWFILRGYSYEEARIEVFHKYRAKLLNDDPITRTIVEYRDIDVYINEAFGIMPKEEYDDAELNDRYIESLCRAFSKICDFSIVDRRLIDPDKVTPKIMETFIANEIVQGFIKQKEYMDAQLRQYENMIDKPKAKAEKLGNYITKYGFLDLPKTKVLIDDSKIALIESIANNGLPYAIAMFEYLGFIKHLRTYSELMIQSALYKALSKWLELKDLSGRSVKGNLLTLNDRTEENKDKYTAHKHIQKVEEDYEKLK